MPVGPIGMLCIRNSLMYGMGSGLVCGLGAAFADSVYGFMAGIGVSVIGIFLVNYGILLKVVGGLFLCYLGLKIFFAKSNEKEVHSENKGMLKFFFSTFFLTLTNPMTILSFAAIYAGLGVGHGEANFSSVLFLTLGVFIGSAAWWLMLSFISAGFKGWMNATAARWLNKVSGSLVFGCGALALMI